MGIIIYSLILSIINIKDKKPIIWITFIGSILLLIYSIISFIVGSSIANNTILNAKLNIYKTYEKLLENKAEDYIQSNSQMPLESDTIILTKMQIDEENSNKCCNGYLIVNNNEQSYKAYVDWGDYKTKEYNNKNQ